ncbi:hypothetical protein Tco_0292343 [Tanacetum coccineum]
MTSFDYRLNPIYAIKECSSCGSLYTSNCGCSKGSLKDKILVPKPPRNCVRCARCGTPVDGPYCQGCALLRKEFMEGLLTNCVENEFFKDFQDTSESSDDNTNVVNAPREPIVVNQDPGKNSSPSPPHIDHCCHECGDSLDGIFCRQCTCTIAKMWEKYRKNASTTNVNVPLEDDQSSLFAYVVWIFLAFLTYPVVPPYLLSTRNEDTIFDPGISMYHSFMPDVSHRSGTFMKFNVYPNRLNESPMRILPSTCFPMDQ